MIDRNRYVVNSVMCMMLCSIVVCFWFSVSVLISSVSVSRIVFIVLILSVSGWLI